MSDLRHTDFLTTLARAAIFIPSTQFAGRHIYVKLTDRWYEKFDSDPIIIPEKDVLPPSVPVLIMQSQSGEWKLQVSRERVDIIFDPKLPSSIDDLSKFFEEGLDYLVEFRKLFNLRVGRLAAICNRLLNQEEPGKALAKHFCREDLLSGPLNRPEGFELHAHKTFTLYGGEVVNSWVRNKTGLRVVSNEPVIIIVQDVNTLAEQVHEREYTDEEMKLFFTASSVELDKILSIYYPE